MSVVEGRQEDSPAFGAAVAAAAGADFESSEVAQKGGVVLAGHLAGGIEKVYLKGQVVGAAKRFVYRAGKGAGQGW